MSIKKTVMLSSAVLLLTLAAGCSGDSRPGEPSENVKQEAGQEYGGTKDSQEIEPEYGEITDPAELERLWREYFYDTIATIGNTREFNSAAEIDPVGVAKYCWFKYVAEHGRESLELAGENSTLRLFPLDTVLKYARRYFNLTELDVSEIKDYYYDPEKHAFTFNFGGKKDRPSRYARNSWGIHLDKVTRNKDGTITAVLKKYDSYRTRRVERRYIYTLKQRKDGSLYFTSGRRNYINNHLVSLSGDYRHFDQIEGFSGSMKELFMMGEDNTRLILAHTPFDKEESASLMLLNSETMQVEKRLELKANFGFTGVRSVGDKIVVRLQDRIITVDKKLERLKEMPLPETIKDKIGREPKRGKDGFPDVYFGGYDISSDLKSIVYADEKGVKLFNLADGSEKMLAPTEPVTGSELLQNSYHSSPRFVDQGQKVITTMTGYESSRGYTLCNLEEGTFKTYSISAEGSSSGLIRYDTGLLEVNTYSYNEAKQKGEYKTMFLDFKTGKVKEIKVADPGKTGIIRDHDSVYVGQNQAAFITYRPAGDYANRISYLNGIDLQTLEVEPKMVSVKAARMHILGVLADGRVVFWYSLNPSENGIGITG